MDSLDHNILVDILTRARLEPLDLCRLSTLGRKWRAACRAPSLWRRVRADGEAGGNLYGAGLEQIASRCGETEEINITHLHILERPNPWLHHGLELLLEGTKGGLKRLSLQFEWQVPFTDRLLGAVGRLCPALEEFTLVAADYLVTETAVAAFLRACTHVHTFHCYVRSAIPIHSLGDNLLWQVNRKWPHLQSLAINGNHITENGVFALASCAHLQSLSLHGYHRGIFERAKTTADGDAVLFPALSSFSFSYNLPSPAELRRILRMCPLLSSLVLHPSPPPPEATPGSPSSGLVSGSRGMHEAVTLKGVVEQECKGAVSVFIEEAPAKKTSYDLTAVAHGLGIKDLTKY
ncbi:unnamed protein product [Closterium sp. Naga37s-1]|nr:unnamed protein product [Closterium sp. Naga37s-1]